MQGENDIFFILLERFSFGKQVWISTVGLHYTRYSIIAIVQQKIADRITVLMQEGVVPLQFTRSLTQGMNTYNNVRTCFCHRADEMYAPTKDQLPDQKEQLLDVV